MQGNQLGWSRIDQGIVNDEPFLALTVAFCGFDLLSDRFERQMRFDVHRTTHNRNLLWFGRHFLCILQRVSWQERCQGG